MCRKPIRLPEIQYPVFLVCNSVCYQTICVKYEVCNAKVNINSHPPPLPHPGTRWGLDKSYCLIWTNAPTPGDTFHLTKPSNAPPQGQDSWFSSKECFPPSIFRVKSNRIYSLIECKQNKNTSKLWKFKYESFPNSHANQWMHSFEWQLKRIKM